MTRDVIELPAPTPWPLVAALGITLTLAGLVTHVFVSIVGFVLVARAAVGWWLAVFPQPQVEQVALRPLQERARPVQPAAQAVEHLVAGIAGHRVRIPEAVHPLSAGFKGGVAGAIAMAALAELYSLIATGSPWYVINLLAGTVMPSFATAPLQEIAAFSAAGLLVAVIVHGVASVFVGLVYAAVLPMFPGHPMLWGGWLAPLLWSALLWSSLQVINPALNARIDWTWFIASQIAFGLVAGIVISRTEKIATLQTWPLAARAGIEAPGLDDQEDA